MLFTNISQDTNPVYRLSQDGLHIFFLLNRSGDITFELLRPGTKAIIFALFTGKGHDAYQLNLIQKHHAATTSSRAVVKSVLSGAATVSYSGTIHIAPSAIKSDAAQESRSLLLSPHARVVTQPNLEIHTDDVQCYHAATVSSVDPEKMFYLGSRGLDPAAASHLIVTGFLGEVFESLAFHGVEVSSLREHVISSLSNQYA